MAQSSQGIEPPRIPARTSSSKLLFVHQHAPTGFNCASSPLTYDFPKSGFGEGWARQVIVLAEEPASTLECAPSPDELSLVFRGVSVTVVDGSLPTGQRVPATAGGRNGEVVSIETSGAAATVWLANPQDARLLSRFLNGTYGLGNKAFVEWDADDNEFHAILLLPGDHAGQVRTRGLGPGHAR